MHRLNKKFFRQNAEEVAKQLLGKVLVHKHTLSGKIVETEAYSGFDDLASHASGKRTERNKIMFESGGVWYIYLIYGIYFNLNIITQEKDFPSGVLIRAIEPLEGLKEMKQNRLTENILNLTSGPGKLCQALKITKSLNATSAISSDSELFIEDRGVDISPASIVKTKRIGVDYAGAWKNKPLRFYIKGSPFISRK